ncbi:MULTISPECIES: hypothetical protein [unclassified Streptomyces]|uniref:hypothetical protein n=1 Tax=unclassified Streptomyces TaxID=2593676 RepID=UPI00166154F5|nr:MULTISPECIES: hypothetical protein [unclassified Streptomyces]MBD0710014.1 hypothetical protein [Streptomyces sp. CBMA291]MBD0715695.1 hypothetical protein [Streptomyces sp. CBMA370]
MKNAMWKRAGVALSATAVIVGVAGCQDDGGDKKAADKPAKAQAQGPEDTSKVIQTAYKKTSAAKSAKVRMTMEMPAAAGGGGTLEMTGVQGWDPAVMDITYKGAMLDGGDGTGPKEMRMIMRDNVMYMDMGAAQAAEMDGKRWMKMDLKALTDAAGGGDKGLGKSMTGGLENMNQDPAQQLALLLQSPDLKHVGAEKVDGVETQHYKGTLTLDQMLAANKSFEAFSEEERTKMVEGVKKAGVTAYDTQVWVGEDGYPVRMDVGVKTKEGSMKMAAHYSDYGTKSDVQAPPAKDTVDFMEMLQEMGQG